MPLEIALRNFNLAVNKGNLKLTVKEFMFTFRECTKCTTKTDACTLIHETLLEHKKS